MVQQKDFYNCLQRMLLYIFHTNFVEAAGDDDKESLAKTRDWATQRLYIDFLEKVEGRSYGRPRRSHIL